MPLDVQIDQKGSGLTEVTLIGRLDTTTAPELERVLAGVVSQPGRSVRFEMSQLNYVSSMGIRVLFSAFKTLKQSNNLLLMVNLQPQIQKVFEIAQALPRESIFASVKEADEYFDAMQRKALGKDNNRE